MGKVYCRVIWSVVVMGMFGRKKGKYEAINLRIQPRCLLHCQSIRLQARELECIYEER